MVRKIYLYVMLWGAVIAQVMGQPKFSSEEVNAMMRKVADWQIANLKEGVEHDDLDWRRAVLYMGMVDWAELVEKKEGNSAYYQWLLRLGRKNHFQMGTWLYHADCIAVGQPFIDLYLRYGDKIMLGPVMSRADWIVANPSHTPMMLDYGKIETLYRWTWCDALFMAPPVYAKLYALSGDRKYLNFMDKEYRASYAYLYDKQDHLFYRDGTYFGKKEANGKKVFWGRGNGWVLGGLVEILQVLPSDDSFSRFYQDLFVELSGRLAELQCPDGYWHASLLDPSSYPSPETSSTGLIVYALAYGINQGLLDREKFLPVVSKGWKALCEAVNSDGKLGYVQPVGGAPDKVSRETTEVYGVGAFLLAGCQIYQLSLN